MKEILWKFLVLFRISLHFYDSDVNQLDVENNLQTKNVWNKNSSIIRWRWKISWLENGQESIWGTILKHIGNDPLMLAQIKLRKMCLKIELFHSDFKDLTIEYSLTVLIGQSQWIHAHYYRVKETDYSTNTGFNRGWNTLRAN